jgi:hypothetical protein
VASDAEIIPLAVRLARGEWHPDVNGWPEGFSDEDRRRVVSFGLYEIQRLRERRCPRQRKAMRLLRSWLPAAARDQLRRSRYQFYLTGASGTVYRLYPRTGKTERVVRHGTRYFLAASFCYHDPDEQLPPADITLAHALLILTDEGRFLREANEHPHQTTMWDPAWRRTVAQARARVWAAQAALEERAS